MRDVPRFWGKPREFTSQLCPSPSSGILGNSFFLGDSQAPHREDQCKVGLGVSQTSVSTGIRWGSG